MFYVRRAKKPRWEPDPTTGAVNIETAALDLDDDDISVYRAETAQEARKLALLHAVCQMPHIENVDFLVIPEKALDSLEVTIDHDPVDDSHPMLCERHYVIRGVEKSGGRVTIAQALVDAGATPYRLKKSGAIEAVLELAQDDPDIKLHAQERWRKRIRQSESSDSIARPSAPEIVIPADEKIPQPESETGFPDK